MLINGANPLNSPACVRARAWGCCTGRCTQFNPDSEECTRGLRSPTPTAHFPLGHRSDGSLQAPCASHDPIRNTGGGKPPRCVQRTFSKYIAQLYMRPSLKHPIKERNLATHTRKRRLPYLTGAPAVCKVRQRSLRKKKFRGQDAGVMGSGFRGGPYNA